MIKFFDKQSAFLGPRFITMNIIFNYLYSLNKPVKILETGCSHRMINYTAKNLVDCSCDGLSTVFFGAFIKNYTKGQLECIDISKEAIENCKKITKEFSDVIQYTVGDSLDVLKSKTKEEIQDLDFIYFDSLDLDIKDNGESSMRHHLEELKIVYPNLSDKAILAFDDHHYWPNGEFAKGKYCLEFLTNNKWKLINDYKDQQWIFKKETF